MMNSWEITWIQESSDDNIISFGIKNCSREDFAFFNASNIYDVLISEPNNAKEPKFCFDFPNNQTLT